MFDVSHGSLVPYIRLAHANEIGQRELPVGAVVHVPYEVNPETGETLQRGAEIATLGNNKNGVWMKWELSGPRVRLAEFAVYQNGKIAPSTQTYERVLNSNDFERALYDEQGKESVRARYANGVTTFITFSHQDGTLERISIAKYSRNLPMSIGTGRFNERGNGSALQNKGGISEIWGLQSGISDKHYSKNAHVILTLQGSKPKEILGRVNVYRDGRVESDKLPVSSIQELESFCREKNVTLTHRVVERLKAYQRGDIEALRVKDPFEGVPLPDVSTFEQSPATGNVAFSLTYRELQEMPAVNADDVEPITNKADLKRAFRGFGVIVNDDDGREALFPAASAGKFMSSTGERAEFILPLLGELYKTSKFVTSSPWKPHRRADGEMSKTHTNYVRYNYYLNKVVRGGKEYYVRLDVTEQKNTTNKVHSGTFSKVEIYEKNGDLVSALGQEPSGIKPPFHDPKIAEWLKEINEKGYAGTNPDVKPGNTALSVGGFGLNANARAEMEKVRRQYEGTDKWMKAPNGKPTKLNERQWLQVRTPSFKAWFGDWENDPEHASKVVDENGEPLVVYHQTNSKAYINRETGQEWDRITPEERQAWRDRGDWDEHWEEQDFYTFDNTRHGRRSIEMPALFFSPEYDEYHEYGNRTVAAFLNLRNPASNPEIPNAGVTDTAGEDAMNALMKQGYDGFIRDDDGAVYEINAFRPEQIKSATDNVGTFDPNVQDIRFSVGERMGGRAPVVEPGGDVREAGEGALAWLRRKFVHSQTPVFDAVRRVMGVGREPPDALNVEAAAKNVHGKIRARQEMLQRAYLEPLKAILAQPGMDRKRFDDYALALHALERNRMIQERSVVVDPTTGEVVDLGVEAGSGVTNAWAERVIREIQRDPFAAQYKEAANILAEMNRFVLRGAVADGLLTEAQARTWMRLSPHYVPLILSRLRACYRTQDAPGEAWKFGGLEVWLWRPVLVVLLVLFVLPRV